MTDREQGVPGHRDCGADAAACALGALEPAEAEAFRHHLESCVVCRDELIAFNAVVDVLPLTAPPQPVPRSLKRHVMAEVKADQRAARTTQRRRSPWLAAFPRPVLATAGATLAVILAVIAITLGGQGGQTRVIRASTSWSGTSAVLRVTGQRGELVVQRMPAPPAGKVYEVWLGRRSRPPAPTTALFSVTATGAGSVDVPGSLRGVSQVMVTPEPAGGSKAPTHAPVLVANLS
jgi:anti-sigma-K factor RskA